MSEEKKLRVCIIGAGVSGLPCIKTCLEEGFKPVCFEKTDDIGGLWNYREHYQYRDGSGYEGKKVLVVGIGNSALDIAVELSPTAKQDLVPVRENRVDLYRRVFPPDFSHPTLAMIGMIQPIGSIQPISEMQGRWAAKVFKGDAQLPSKQEMWKEITDRTLETKKRYFDSPKHTIQVDYVPYMEELAKLIGVNLPYFQLMVRDPRLLAACVFGPCTPYTYRLTGPDSWSGARQAILTTKERVFKPLQSRKLTEKMESTGEKSILYSARLIGVVLSIFLFFGIWQTVLAPGSGAVFWAWTVGFLTFLAGFLLMFDSYFDLSTIV